jgi:hypothetical protein
MSGPLNGTRENRRFRRRHEQTRTDNLHHEGRKDRSAAEPPLNSKTGFTTENAEFAEGFYFKISFLCVLDASAVPFLLAAEFARAVKIFNQ